MGDDENGTYCSYVNRQTRAFSTNGIYTYNSNRQFFVTRAYTGAIREQVIGSFIEGQRTDIDTRQKTDKRLSGDFNGRSVRAVYPVTPVSIMDRPGAKTFVEIVTRGLIFRSRFFPYTFRDIYNRSIPTVLRSRCTCICIRATEEPTDCNIHFHLRVPPLFPGCIYIYIYTYTTYSLARPVSALQKGRKRGKNQQRGHKIIIYERIILFSRDADVALEQKLS